MVVLAAAILTKGGKTLISRQFVDMSRIRIEGLLSAFPKLMDNSKQYTYFETETVRYLYQPIEGLYLVMITNRSSNIVEDLDTLRLLGRLTTENCPTAGPIDEDTIKEASFEILFSFDEVVQLGYKENVTLDQVAFLLKMDSEEARVAKALMETKVDTANAIARDTASRLAKEKSRTGGISSKDFQVDYEDSSEDDIMSPYSSSSTKRQEPTVVPQQTQQQQKPTKKSSSAMMLPSKKGKSNILAQMKKRGEIDETSPTSAPPAAASSSSTTPSQQTQSTPVHQEPFHLKLDEKINASLNRDGGFQSVEVKGDAFLTVSDSSCANAKIRLAPLTGNVWAWKTHPNINKQFFTKEHVLGLKDPSKPFPTGTSLSVLRWRLQNAAGFTPPLTISCWPSDSSVTIEYELEGDIALNNVEIAIPMAATPSVSSIDDGEYQWTPSTGVLTWSLPTINQDNSQGSMECDLDGECNPDDFFPIQVNFVGESCISGVKVEDVISTEDGSSIPHSTEVVLQVEGYEVV